MTTGYQAALDASDVRVSFAVESVYNTNPAVAFQFIRLLSESLSVNKTRVRPAEIQADGQASHALTTRIEAAGDLSFALSYTTYDSWLQQTLNAAAFTSPVSVTGTDIAFVDPTPGVASSGNPGLTSTTVDKFNTLRVGDWVRVSGAATAGNNGVFRVHAVVTGASASVQFKGPGAASIVDGAAGPSITVGNAGRIRNGVTINTMHVEKELTPSGHASPLFLLYKGVYIAGASLSAQLGGFLEGTFNLLAANESLTTTTTSTGSRTAAPTGRVIDTVTGVRQTGLGDAAFDATNPPGYDSILQGINLSLVKENARTQFGIGSSSGRGIGRGTITVSGTCQVYFRNRHLYDVFVAESDNILSFAALDDQLDGYVISMPAVTLMNPSIVAGGPDTDMVAEFQLEGNPGTFPGTESPVATPFTIQIDKIT